MADVAKQDEEKRVLEAPAFLTEEEYEMLQSNMQTRKKLSEALIPENMKSVDNGTARVIKEILESTDASITRLGELRLKSDANQTDSRAVSLAQEIFSKPFINPARTVAPEDVALPDGIEPTVIVPHEMSTEKEVLELSDFISDGKEPDV